MVTREGKYRQLSEPCPRPVVGLRHGYSSKKLHPFYEIKPWLEWWLRNTHAQMLFPPFQKTKKGLYQAIGL
ncbi:uncharacterized protein BJ212DRAFT_1377582 [Suillus subaureus]|uniref:Uncharacterized protein n=1 Tax=Suillus subaureus TaxID=48587 RepID=A0A9P7JA78_9AGAM|nr:uncharacterized protein BJ212DRAFT_1377582 [Suillus subaureus]KAG1810580.1 hypothetical protein BJ212DRAFT_1377582 [Suillus subaureus]